MYGSIPRSDDQHLFCSNYYLVPFISSFDRLSHLLLVIELLASKPASRGSIVRPVDDLGRARQYSNDSGQGNARSDAELWIGPVQLNMSL